MAIPTQFSVTSTRTSPISNPALPQDPPQTADAESVSIVDGASVLPALSVGDINAPSEASALPSAAIDTPNEYTAESVVILDAPTAASSESAAAIDTPTEATAEAVAVTDTPSEATAEPAATASSPSTLTATAGTLTTPPFPLNHARILYRNKLEVYDTVTASEGTPLNALKPNTFERWEFDSTASNSAILIRLPSTRTVDTICIGAHNLGSINATVSITYSVDGVAFLDWEPDFAVTSDAPIMRHIETPRDLVAIQISITSGVTGAGFIGHISAGEALQMQRPFFNGHTPITDADVTGYYHNKTESGNIIGQAIRAQGYKTSYEWQNIDDTWYRTYIPDFKKSVKLKPFYIAWNLLEYPLDVGFGRVAQDISASMQNGTVTKRGGLSFELLGF